MKKSIKNVIAIILFTIVAIAGMNVHAQSTITVDKKTYLYTESQRQTKFHTTKGYAYCITPNRTGPAEGRTLTYKSSQASGGVLYLLDHAGTSDNEYLATQLAVWLYDSNHMSDFWKNHGELEVVKKAKSLAAEAAKNSNYTHTPRISITTSNTNLAITSDNKYYRSGAISVSMGYATEATLTLEGAPSGAKIVNAQYSAISKAKNNDKIYVQIPEANVTATTTFTIKATVTGKRAEIERYTTGDSSIQELIVLVKVDKTVNDAIKLKVTPVKRSCDEVNGKYYDKNGKVVDKDTYTIECLKPTCTKVGDKYLGKNGTVVTYDEYLVQCNQPCTPVGDKYIGKDGKLVTKEEYVIQCEKPICKPVGDKYLGKNGTEVTYEEYLVQCYQPCTPVGDKYIGKDGKLVTKEEYVIQCEKPTCTPVGDKYLGKNGTEVDYETYIIQCKNPSCDIIDNMYFGKNGTRVTAEEYKKQCTTIPVPDTGTSMLSELLYLIIGSIVLGTSMGVITYKKNMI